jgi:hypothetical protein
MKGRSPMTKLRRRQCLHDLPARDGAGPRGFCSQSAAVAGPNLRASSWMRSNRPAGVAPVTGRHVLGNGRVLSVPDCPQMNGERPIRRRSEAECDALASLGERERNASSGGRIQLSCFPLHHAEGPRRTRSIRQLRRPSATKRRPTPPTR